MKLYTYIFLILSYFYAAQASQAEHTALTMPNSIWKLTTRTIIFGTTTEVYCLADGPKPLPVEIQTLALLAPLCCCSRKIKEYIAEYENWHKNDYDSHTKTLKQYYPYKKIDA